MIFVLTYYDEVAGLSNLRFNSHISTEKLRQIHDEKLKSKSRSLKQELRDHEARIHTCVKRQEKYDLTNYKHNIECYVNREHSLVQNCLQVSCLPCRLPHHLQWKRKAYCQNNYSNNTPCDCEYSQAFHVDPVPCVIFNCDDGSDKP